VAGVAFDSARVTAAAAVAGVAVQPLPRFALGEGFEGLLLGFGSIAAADIPDGVRLLAEAVSRTHAG
jgi:GntR family transcriptional regulator/MocR family aminotransferase